MKLKGLNICTFMPYENERLYRPLCLENVGFIGRVGTPIVYDTIAKDTSTQSSPSSTSSQSKAITIGSNSNRCLFVAIGYSDTTKSVSSVKIGSTNFTKAGESKRTGANVEIWYLTQTAGLGTGSQTVDVVLSASTGSWSFGLLSVYNIDQSITVGVTASNTNAGATVDSISITPLTSHSWIFAGHCHNAGNSFSTSNTNDWNRSE